MLLFDSVALATTGAWILAMAMRTRLPRRSVTVVVAIVVVAASTHLVIEGFRWQMAPAYFGFLIVLLASAVSGRPWLTNALVVTAGMSAASSLAASVAFPVFTLPTPSGPLAIGTAEQHLVDAARPEAYSSDPDDRRELMLRVWYPSPATTGDVEPYWRDGAVRSRAVTSMTPLPWFTFTHLGLTRTHSITDAPIDTGARYPAIIYSHGLGIGWAGANMTLVEELASHGYIVIAINHAHLGSMSIFPDGRQVPFDTATARAMATPPPDEIRELQVEMQATRDATRQIALYDHGMALMPDTILGPVTRALDVQGADQRALIDQLEAWRTNGTGPAWASAIDLDRIGLMGMSLGGSAAFETCRLDPRCRAGVNIDGFHPRQLGVGQHNAPFLYFNRAEHLLYTANVEHSSAPSRVVLVHDVTHFNFFDFALMSPLYRALGVLGPIDGRRGLEILSHHARVFFDRTLKGLGSRPRDYPGVIVQDAGFSE